MVIGSNPIIYPRIFKKIFKKRIRKFPKKLILKNKSYLINFFLKRFFEIRTFFISNYTYQHTNIFKNQNQIKKLFLKNNKLKLFNLNEFQFKKKSNFLINISQKKNNPKATIVFNKTLATFSVGSIIRYLKIKQEKFIRRSSKGSKIFLNFLKTFFLKKFSNKNKQFIILNICGFNYNLYYFKNKISTILPDIKTQQSKAILLFSLKIPFNKVKSKKIKSIKKRLQKKILLEFLKKPVL